MLNQTTLLSNCGNSFVSVLNIILIMIHIIISIFIHPTMVAQNQKQIKEKTDYWSLYFNIVMIDWYIIDIFTITVSWLSLVLLLTLNCADDILLSGSLSSSFASL